MLGVEPRLTRYKQVALPLSYTPMGFIYSTVFSLAPGVSLLLGVMPVVSDYASVLYWSGVASSEA
jgi:hypothetical protein